MSRSDNRQRIAPGFTLLELLFVAALLSLLLVGIFGGILGIQKAFTQDVILSDLYLRAQNAMERMVELSGQSLTTDAEYALLKPAGGGGYHCLHFRLVQSIDGVTGLPVYDSALQVFIYGPDAGTYPSSGLIIGRGPDLATIHGQGKGADGVLGTKDDDHGSVSMGIPAVELLIPSNYAPSSGEMFTVTATPDPDGRLLEFKLRMNAAGSDGAFLLPQDLVLTRRLALKQ